MTSSSIRYAALTRLQPITQFSTPPESIALRRFTALFVAKRHSDNSQLFMRSDLKEVFD